MRIQRYETGWFWCPACEVEYFIERGRPEELVCPECRLGLDKADAEVAGLGKSEPFHGAKHKGKQK